MKTSSLRGFRIFSKGRQEGLLPLVKWQYPTGERMNRWHGKYMEKCTVEVLKGQGINAGNCKKKRQLSKKFDLGPSPRARQRQKPPCGYTDP
jgi:hypothetical protein